MEKAERARRVLSTLLKKYSNPDTALKHKTPLELLVATILSAQCTDVRVNMVTKELFKKYKTVKDYAHANQEEFEQDVRSTGFYKNKTKNIIAMAKMLEEKFNGKVPQSMEELIQLPGVARKTANIVLSRAYGKNEGIAIDTHNRRITYRLELTKNKDPNKIEQDIMKLIPQKDWDKFSLALIEHGREVCRALIPSCSKCVVENLCPKTGVTKHY